MGIGMRELIIILLVVLLVFGAKKLRTIGSDLGAAVKGFKKGMAEGEEEKDPLKALQQDKPDAEFPESAAKKSNDAAQNDRKA